MGNRERLFVIVDCHYKQDRLDKILSEVFPAVWDQTLTEINSNRGNSAIRYRFLTGTWERPGTQISG